MSQILSDMRNVFRRKDDTLTQLILVNAGVFIFLNLVKVLLYLAQADPGAQIFGAIESQFMMPAYWRDFITHPWTIFTYFFSHEDFFHILSNMLFLFWFGQLIQEYLGSARLLSLYLLGGFVGGLVYLLAYNTIPVFAGMAPVVSVIGASGAVYAVVVGAATLLPNYTFNLLFIGSVRIIYIAGVFVLLSFIRLPGGNAGGNLAHLGGALLGFIYISQLRSGRDLGAPLHKVIAWAKGLFSRKSRMQVSYRQPARFEAVSQDRKPAQRVSPKANTTPNGYTDVDEEEVNTILDKISKSGYDSLSREEKQKLFAASQKK